MKKILLILSVLMLGACAHKMTAEEYERYQARREAYRQQLILKAQIQNQLYLHDLYK